MTIPDTSAEVQCHPGIATTPLQSTCVAPTRKKHVWWPVQAQRPRWYSSADGEYKSYQPVWLSDFLAQAELVRS